MALVQILDGSSKNSWRSAIDGVSESNAGSSSSEKLVIHHLETLNLYIQKYNGFHDCLLMSELRTLATCPTASLTLSVSLVGRRCMKRP